MLSSEAQLPLIQLLRRDGIISANARLQPLSGGGSSEIFLIEDNGPLRVVKRALASPTCGTPAFLETQWRIPTLLDGKPLSANLGVERTHTN